MSTIKTSVLACTFLLSSSCLFAQWGTNGTSIYNSNTGSVGIGLGSPDMKLTVAGGIRVDAAGQYSGSPYNNSPWLSFGVGSGEGIASNRAASAPNQVGLDLYCSFAPRLSITNAGYVGVGTQTPDMKLSVMGNVRVDGGDAFNGGAAGTNTYPALSFGATGSGEGIGSNRPAGSLNQNGLDFYTGFVIRFSVSRAGNVLIGKTSQTNTNYKLDVAGSARADKLTVNTTGADFVFAPTYQLPSLTKVEAYINANHHLPDIASAEDMKKDGLDVGGNQTKLLQKIEELTLYMIDMKKENEAIRKENRTLKHRLDHLERKIK